MKFALADAKAPKSSIDSLSVSISTSKVMGSGGPSPNRVKRLLMSVGRPPSSLILDAASIKVMLAEALRNLIASKRFDFPTPFKPAIHENGPNRISTSVRFLKPEIFSLVIIEGGGLGIGPHASPR